MVGEFPLARRRGAESRAEPAVEDRGRGDGSVGGLQDGPIRDWRRHGETGQEIAGRSLHHLDLAAGGRPQAGLLGGSDHDGGPSDSTRPDHITYMRTDSVNLSSLAINTTKDEIIKTLGERYLHTRNYHTHTKGAQEAHEAIRPTYISHHEINSSAQEKRLYELIWKRTIASQMSDAELEKDHGHHHHIGAVREYFVAVGEVLKFDGFLKVYMESTDDDGDTEGNDKMLPPLKPGETLSLSTALATERFSQAPARYTRGQSGAQARRVGYRSTFDLCPHHLDDSAARVCREGRPQGYRAQIPPAHAERWQHTRRGEDRGYRCRQRQTVAHRHRCSGERFPHQVFSRDSQLQLHRQRRAAVRRDCRGQGGVERRDRPLLQTVPPRGRECHGPAPGTQGGRTRVGYRPEERTPRVGRR